MSAPPCVHADRAAIQGSGSTYGNKVHRPRELSSRLLEHIRGLDREAERFLSFLERNTRSKNGPSTSSVRAVEQFAQTARQLHRESSYRTLTIRRLERYLSELEAREQQVFRRLDREAAFIRRGWRTVTAELSDLLRASERPFERDDYQYRPNPGGGVIYVPNGRPYQSHPPKLQGGYHMPYWK